MKSASMDFFPEVVSIVLLRDDDLVTRESLSCKSDTFFRPVFLGGISTFVIQMDNSQHSAMSIGDDCHMEHATSTVLATCQKIWMNMNKGAKGEVGER